LFSECGSRDVVVGMISLNHFRGWGRRAQTLCVFVLERAVENVTRRRGCGCL
jgi:hypothetical protein